MKKIGVIIFVLFTLIILTACGKRYRVTFMDGAEIIDVYSVKEDSLIQEPETLLSESHDFVGWFKDIEDESTKWNFNVNVVTSHLLLKAKWQLKKEVIKISNFSYEDNILTWDAIEGAVYELKYLDKVETLTNPSYDFKDDKELFINSVEITITPIKGGFDSFNSTATLTYKDESIDEQLVLSFDELSKTGYAASTLEYNDVNIIMDQSLVGSLDNDKKNGTKSARLQENGVIEIVEAFDNFEKMTFELAYYGAHNKSQVLSVYYKTLQEDEWQLAKDYIVTFEQLTKQTITKEELNLIDGNVFFKFVKDNKEKASVNIDDIIVYEFAEESFTFEIENNTTEEENEIVLTEYYKTAEGLQGKELVEELRIILNTNIVLVSYGDARYELAKSDLNPKNDKEVIGMYDSDSIANYWIGQGAGAWQREHVWPNSKLGIKRVNNSSKNQGSDLHNLRAITGINQTRSNRYFELDKVDGNGTATTIGAEAFFPSDVHKGDTARILLYMAVKYDFLTLTDNISDLKNNPSTNYELNGAFMGKLSLLKDWHEEDKVDEFEKIRNNVIFGSQKNRNPFIDHPKLFTSVFNYFTELDNNRVKISVYVDVYINFSEFKENKYKYVV